MVGMLLLVICLKSSVWSCPLYGRYASLGSKDSSITVKAKNILEKVRVHGNSRSPPPCELGHLGTETLVANVVSGMGWTAVCAGVVQCNVRNSRSPPPCELGHPGN